VGRRWVDVNGDGLADWCRRMDFTAATCTLSAASTFGATISGSW
jgi:hypothetical protein